MMVSGRNCSFDFSSDSILSSQVLNTATISQGERFSTNWENPTSCVASETNIDTSRRHQKEMRRNAKTGITICASNLSTERILCS